MRRYSHEHDVVEVGSADYFKLGINFTCLEIKVTYAATLTSKKSKDFRQFVKFHKYFLFSF